MADLYHNNDSNHESDITPDQDDAESLVRSTEGHNNQSHGLDQDSVKSSEARLDEYSDNSDEKSVTVLP